MKNFFGKKSRGALALVLIISLCIHLVALLIFGTIKLVEAAFREETVFEAAPVEVPQQIEPEYQVNLEQRTRSTPPRLSRRPSWSTTRTSWTFRP